MMFQAADPPREILAVPPEMTARPDMPMPEDQPMPAPRPAPACGASTPRAGSSA
jgi:hypothetical protein